VAHAWMIMPSEHTGLAQLAQEYPIEEHFKWWVAYKPGEEDEKAKEILVDIFLIILKRLKHYHSNLRKPETWNMDFFQSVLDNLDYVLEKAEKVLERKAVVNQWGNVWKNFCDDVDGLLIKQFIDMRFNGGAVFLHLQKRDKKQEIPTGQNPLEVSEPKSEDLEDDLKVHGDFKKFVQGYNEFFRLLEGSVQLIQTQMSNNDQLG
jgi:hypothetical protein